MQEVRIGEFIQKERIRQGITQEELCDGICSAVTLSRLENGGSNPSLSLVNALLQRLKLDGGRFFALLTPQERQVEDLTKEIISCNVRCQHALEAERPAIRAEGYAKIHALEQVMDKSDHITAQFILRSQVLLGREDGSAYTLEERLELLTKAIRATVPKFDLEHLEKGHYTLTEMKILVQIASAYGNAQQREKAIELYQKLLDYAQNCYRNIREANGLIPMITHNYAGELRMLDRYQEAIEIGELGRQSCINYGHYQHLGGILHNLGECYHFLGDDEKGLDCFFEAYFQYKAAGNKNGVALLQADAKAYYGILQNLTAVTNGLLG